MRATCALHILYSSEEEKGANIMAELINLTPHGINIFTADGEHLLDVPASGMVARCSQSNVVVGEVNGIPVTRQSFGDVVDLPEARDGIIYIVSRLVAAACPDREDLLIPGPLVRDAEGRPCGCQGLSRL